MSEKQGLNQPPQYAADPQPQVVYVQQQVASVPVFGEVPVTVTCPQGHQVLTNVHYKSGMMVWVVVGVMILLGFLCFAWIPFLVDSLKDVVHTCPQDGTIIGVYERLKL